MFWQDISNTTFGDFDAIKIDQLILISRSTLFKNFTCVAKLMRFALILSSPHEPFRASWVAQDTCDAAVSSTKKPPLQVAGAGDV